MITIEKNICMNEIHSIKDALMKVNPKYTGIIIS